MLKPFFAFILILFVGLAYFSPSALAADNSTQIFATHCAGCHINGGNIVRRNKTLKLKALQRNKMNSIEAITEIVTNGKGNMSAYKERLSSDEIEAVAAYVLEQAEKNWE